MSLKNRDSKNRWRNKIVAFRVSPEEDEQIDAAVRLSGLTKQDYITRRLLCRDVVVQGNPKVYKALRDQLAAVLDELRRVEDGAGVDDELLDTIQLITAIMGRHEGRIDRLMDSKETKRDCPGSVCCADGEQPISHTPTASIAEDTTENNPPEKNYAELLRKMQRMNDPGVSPPQFP